MKRTEWLFAVTLIFLSCNKGKDPGIKVNIFTAKVNNKSLNANETTYYTLNAQLHIEGQSEDRIITISIPDYAGPGAYHFSSEANAVYIESGVNYIAEDGYLNIQSDDSRNLKGKFHFNCSYKGLARKIADGNFSLAK